MPRDLSDTIKTINKALSKFDKTLPDVERSMIREILGQLKRLDTVGDTVKTTVNNLSIVNSIQKKLLGAILTDKYLASVKDFVDQFNTITTIQNEYFASLNDRFKPKTILRELKKTSITNTVAALTEAGIGREISNQISDILRTNITTGGSYEKLSQQLTESVGNTVKYAKQITTDAINQYNRQYTQLVSADLGYEWFAYENSTVKQSRPFCLSLRKTRFFHVSEIPGLLKAKDMYYIDPEDGKEKKVRINPSTNLPDGFYPNTNASNFIVYAGGYNCRHSVRPIAEFVVPVDIRNEVYSTSAYKAWKKLNPGKAA